MAQSKLVKLKKEDIAAASLSLINNLEEQRNLHKHLKLVLAKETELKADCELSELETIQQRKIQVAGKLFEVETKRKKIVEELSNTLDLKIDSDNSEHLTLSRLIQFLPESDSKKLVTIQDELKKLISEIQFLGQQTSSLAKARLISLRTTTTQIDKWMVHHTFYSKQGDLTSNARSRILNCRV